MSKKDMTVAGVMSGTSADGINVALVRIRYAGSRAETKATSRIRGRVATAHTSLALVGHHEYAYPAKVRAAVLATMNATHLNFADLSRLNFLLGELYADAVLPTQQKVR